MPVDFFTAHCTQSQKDKFGLVDDPPPAKNPAYISETNISDCQGIVHNPKQITVDFYGLDHSLVIHKPAPNNLETESLCDGMLQHSNHISFIELKDRQYSGWVVKSTDQLINTTKLFAAHHNLNAYDSVKAYVCNKMRPSATQNHAIQIERYRDETRSLQFKGLEVGLEMDIRREIVI